MQAHGNYAFGYDIVDAHGASNSRSEVGDAHGNKQGSYTLHDIDGRARRVDYVADSHGFRAVVNTNEPGTAHSAPAASLTASPYAAPVAPIGHHAPIAVAHAAPVAVAYSAPIAVAHPAPVAVAHSAPVAYSTSTTVDHVAPVIGHYAAAPVAHVAAAPLAVSRYGHIGANHLAYANGIASHGILAHRLGGIHYSGLRSHHY